MIPAEEALDYIRHGPTMHMCLNGCRDINACREIWKETYMKIYKSVPRFEIPGDCPIKHRSDIYTGTELMYMTEIQAHEMTLVSCNGMQILRVLPGRKISFDPPLWPCMFNQLTFRGKATFRYIPFDKPPNICPQLIFIPERHRFMTWSGGRLECWSLITREDIGIFYRVFFG